MGATAVPHKTRHPGTFRLQKKKRRAPAMPGRVSKKSDRSSSPLEPSGSRLLSYDQLLDQRLSVNLESIEVHTGSDIFSSH